MIATARRAARAEAESDISRARTTADNATLVGLLDACEAAGVERHALIMRLSNLPSDLCRPHHVRLARVAAEPLEACDRARVFYPSQADTVIVWRGEAGPLLGRVRAAVAHLFSDLLDGETAGLTRHLTLPRDGMILRGLLPSTAHPIPPTVDPDRKPPIKLAALARLEARLADADIARLTCRRPVRRLSRDGEARLAWEERTLSLPELGAALLPEFDLRADPWLFRRLTRSLDRRMLTLLATSGELTDAPPFSLNLTVGSLLSPEFQRFDTALPRHLRGQVIVELQPAEIMADPARFIVARDICRARGFRMLIRLSAPSQVALLPIVRLGVDLVRLRWSEALEDWVPPASLDLKTLVLGRAGGRDARAWGQANGITLFGGDR